MRLNVAFVVLFCVVFFFVAYATAEARIVVDQSQFTMNVYAHSGEHLARYPVAVGRPSAPTPNGGFRITAKVRHPDWLSPSGKVIPGRSERNPLREYWFTLSAPADPPGSIGIHGTSRPQSMGTRQSHGCVRLRPADAVRLARLVNVGERVVIQP